MDKVYSRKNLKLAWEHVRAYQGASGADKVTIEECETTLDENLERLNRELRENTYQPQAGNDGIGGGCTTLWGCPTLIECDAVGRKSLQQDRSHKLWREANGGAQCGKSARCVRRGGGSRRGVGRDLRATPARQPSTVVKRGKKEAADAAAICEAVATPTMPFVAPPILRGLGFRSNEYGFNC